MKRSTRGCGCVIAVLVLSSLALSAPHQKSEESQTTKILFFDVLSLPARIDEPRLVTKDGALVVNCAVANRSSERLLGLRLILLVVEDSGRLHNRITWTEPAEIESASIKTFAFHPNISKQLPDSDHLFLGIDEVIGYETIWRAVDADKALRAYSRGRHDVLPTVQAVANKFDPRSDAVRIIWR